MNNSTFRPQDFQPIISFIWSVADTLRDHYTKGKYRDVILPMVVIRRLDAVLESSKAQVLATYKKYENKSADFRHPFLISAETGSGHCFYNTSPYTLKDLLNSPNTIRADLENYLGAFSSNVREIIEKFNFLTQVKMMDESGILYTVIQKFCDSSVNFSMQPVKSSKNSTLPALSNLGMGYVFEELIRKFNEENNEEAGEHFTPREVIGLMTHLLFLPVKDKFAQSSFSIYDNACGSGGMLTESKTFITDPKGKIASSAPIELFGQEINPESYAICKADMMIKGENPDNIKFGSTLSADKFSAQTFDFMLTNPPYGKEWGNDMKKICGGTEKKDNCTDERFANVGLCAKSDGQMMFLLNQISKMKNPANSPLGSRIASVHNGSSLFNSDGGMVAIRKHIITRDLLEAIIALPTDMFYNTGIPTFIWILSNNKEPRRKGKVQLINATSERFYTKMKKSLGKKSKEMRPEHIEKITDLFLRFADKSDDESCLILENDDFGYRKVIIERPKSAAALLENEKFAQMKDKDKILEKLKEIEDSAQGVINFHSRADFVDFLGVKLSKSEQNLLIDADKNANTEKIPLKTPIADYYQSEVAPFVPHSWISAQEPEIGYEVLFNKYFYAYTPPRDLGEISGELVELEKGLNSLLGEILR